MLRAAVISALLIPALAHADSPSSTPPVEPAAPTDLAPPSDSPPPTYAPPSDSPSPTYVPPSSYAPAFSPSAPMGPGAEQPLPPESTGTRSYRHLTAGTDFASICMLGLAANSRSEGLVVLSIGTYALGAPLVHAMKGRPGRALASAGLRVGLPILGAFVGHATQPDYKCTDDDIDCGDDGVPALFGIGLGIITAMVVDSAFLAGGDAPPAKPQPQWSPTVGASQGGFALGAAGTF